MLTVYHSPAQLFFCTFFCFSAASALTLFSFTTEHSSFALSNVVIATVAIPNHWAFYF